ncbi:MAG TPA: helix-turn-helix transcriptional regulator [Burkholderiaceae bacterium]|jgi:DNA-binding XRE family transcriptional regulator|nr:helix-turn-helix transcriptional regulator [Burkholderiaceae bacterium]
MDKRRKHFDAAADARLRQELYAAVAANTITIAEAVKTMRRASHLTQVEFAAHRGISPQALRQVEYGTGNPTVETLNKIASVFGLEVGFVPKRQARR